MRLGQDVLIDLPRALEHEWMLVNGLGGSASGNAAGATSRRTHALLTVAGSHGALTTLLLRLDERLVVDSVAHDLATAFPAPGTTRPAGHLLLEEFRLDPWPVWRWRAGGAVLEKSLFLVHGHHAVAVQWRLLEGLAARLTVSPLVVGRAPRALQRETPAAKGMVGGVPGRVQIETGAGVPALHLWHNGSFLPARVWQRGLDHPADRAAGLATGEDALVPGYVEATLAAGGSLELVAGIEVELFRALAVEGRLGTPPPRTLAECVAPLAAVERSRLAALRRSQLEGSDFTARQAAAAHGGPGEAVARRPSPLLDASDPWIARLGAAVRDAVVRRGHRTTLLSGLPDGEESGLVALRSLPALVAVRDFETTAAVVRGYVEHLDDGLAPESFDPVDGRPVYGDAEPALWLVHSGELLARRSEDLELVREGVYPMLESVMQYYRAGTRGGVRVDADGLLATGEGERAVKPAGLNALWYHALVAMAQLARLVGRKESGAFYLAWAREHQKRFLEAFWDESRGALHDAIGASGPIPGVSASQLLAVSLSPSLLPPEPAARLVGTIEHALVTPAGLRLAPGDPRVRSAGLGDFFTAWLRVHGRGPEAQGTIRGWFDGLERRAAATLGGHRPSDLLAVGAGFQAVPGPSSTLAAAELLRVWIEEVGHAEEPAGVA